MEACPGCGLVLPPVTTSGHGYLGASPACWALFGTVLAREYGDPGLMTVHRLTVDAYAAQHPGQPERRTIQSINVHLVGLHLALDRRAPERMILAALRRLSDDPPQALAWLDPPVVTGEITVADVASAPVPDHPAVVQRWAESVWASWRDHHGAVARLAAAIG